MIPVLPPTNSEPLTFLVICPLGLAITDPTKSQSKVQYMISDKYTEESQMLHSKREQFYGSVLAWSEKQDGLPCFLG